MPVYNEEGAIEKVINSWTTELKNIGMNFQLHVYNDGSTDKTLDILKIIKKTNDHLIIHNKTNSGHGPTILQGYLENCEISKWIFQTDSDNEMGAEWFHRLWHKRHNYEFIIGRRRVRKGPLSRKIVSWGSRLIVRLFYGPGIYDVNSAYRLMKVNVFRPCFYSIPEDTFAPNVIISGYAALKKLKSIEIDVPYKIRTTGTVSIKKMKLLRGVMKSFIQTILFKYVNCFYHKRGGR